MIARFESPIAALDHLHSIGYLYPDATQGMQYDLVSAWKPVEGGAIKQTSLCGVNCTTEKGQYTCPSAITMNAGASKTTFAPASFIVAKALIVEQGLDLVRHKFARDDVYDFCQRSEIKSTAMVEALVMSFLNRRTEFNCFGGDSEQHPEVVQIIRTLKTHGMKINLTATGLRWVNDPEYPDELLADPPQVICVSYDAPSLDEFRRYADMSLADIRAEIRALDRSPTEEWRHGQLKKALASIFVARYLSSQSSKGLPCGLLFNTVLHPGNIRDIDQITKEVEAAFPGSIVNPYPGQSAFDNTFQDPGEEYLVYLERFVDRAIEKTLSGKRFVKRLHYWLMLKAAFVVYRDDREALKRAMSGYGVWTCFEEPMAGFYVQPSRSPIPKQPLIQLTGKSVRPDNVPAIPGGYLGCFWNPFTVTENDQQITSPQQVYDHIMQNMMNLAARAKQEDPDHACGGSIMPRLGFNGVTTEKGMNQRLRPTYRELRRQYAGF